jgi:glycosyltransferase involved in cell wall biosynthesis
LERLFWRIFLPNLDGIICFSEPGKKQLFAEHPRTKSIPTFVIPRGHYRGAYPDTMTKSEAREALKIHAHEFVILFLGQIRRYKGVGRLIQCFARAQISCAQLLIAGRPMDDVIRREINDAAAQSPHVRLFLDFVDQNDIQKFFRAADLVVLPYKEISNSGSAILALSFDRPVLLPMLGALPGLQQIGSDWVKLYKGELTPEIISDAINWTKRRHVALGARAPLEDFNWDHTAQATIRAFKFTVDCCGA